MHLQKKDAKKCKEQMQLFCIAGSVFLIHMSVSFFVRTVYLRTDGFAVAAIASYFAGENWSSMVQNIAYYGYGQAILYIPIFLFTKNPIVRYILMGTVNSALLATIPIFIYKILEFIDFQSHKKRCCYAMIVALFPSYLIYTKWIWNETLLCVLPWILLFLILKLLDEKCSKKINSITLAFLSVYCYAVHGRGILFIAIVLFIIFYLWIIHKKQMVCLPSFAGGIVISYLIYDFVKQKLLNELWLLDEGKIIGNTLSFTLQRTIPTIFTPEKIFGLVQTAISQIMTATFSSYGFLIVVTIFFVCLLYEKAKRHDLNKYTISNVDVQNFEVVEMFSVLSFLGALVISIINLAGGKGDFLLYTRYYANTLGFVVLLGLLIINETKFLKKLIFIFVSLFTLCIPSLFLAAPQVGFTRPFVFFNLYPYILTEKRNSLLLAGIILLFLFVVILGTANITWKLNVTILAVIFLEAYYYCGFNYIIPNTNNILKTVESSIEVLSSVQTATKDYKKIYYYDPNSKRGPSDGAFQFMLPNYKVTKIKELVNGENILDDITLNSIIYSAENLKLEFLYNNCYRVLDERLDFSGCYVWVYGEDINTVLTNEGVLNTQNNYGMPIYPEELLLGDFKSFNGKYEDGKIVSSGSEGYLLYGPYIPLNEGIYQINISGKLYEGDLDSNSFFDVSCNGGGEIIKEIHGLNQFVKENKFDLQVRFKTLYDFLDCEFRIYVNEGVLLEIDQVEIDRF